jgi:hypothetical protein
LTSRHQGSATVTLGSVEGAQAIEG